MKHGVNAVIVQDFGHVDAQRLGKEPRTQLDGGPIKLNIWVLRAPQVPLVHSAAATRAKAPTSIHAGVH